MLRRLLVTIIRSTPPPRLTAAEVLAQLCAVQDTIQHHKRVEESAGDEWRGKVAA